MTPQFGSLCNVAMLQSSSWAVAKFQIYKIAKLHNCKVVKLQSWVRVGLWQQTKEDFSREC